MENTTLGDMTAVNQPASPMPIRLVALEIALSYVGQKEEPGNRGKFVADCLKLVGLGEGYSWCQAFVYRCYHEAAERLGIANPVPRTAGVIDCWRKRSRGMLSLTKDNVLPGYQLIIDHGGGKGHTGLIVSVEDDGTLVTVEGNSNDNGSANGDGCYLLHRRHLSDKEILGCIMY